MDRALEPVAAGRELRSRPHLSFAVRWQSGQVARLHRTGWYGGRARLRPALHRVAQADDGERSGTPGAHSQTDGGVLDAVRLARGVETSPAVVPAVSPRGCPETSRPESASVRCACAV